jgi:hypothetical protein
MVGDSTDFDRARTLRRIRMGGVVFVGVFVLLAALVMVARPVGTLGGDSFLAVCLLCLAGLGAYLFFYKTL